MGQAWCKEKTSKAQDSKSPLDRVFVRCAHRIYPGLKEEGSVLGGATQRVTSSEIGYAGSPPRDVLTRGRSIDSVDRPFHPSEWVDVNLEVPSTPRASSVITNLTVDTNLYPAGSRTSSCSNLKDATPVPPPRRRKRNKGRPLPPKPDEMPEKTAGSNPGQVEATEEPLYSSVRSPKTSGDEQDREGESRKSSELPREDGKRNKEVYEHKVNGTGRIIPREVVSGKRSYHPEERGSRQIPEACRQDKKIPEDEEYERFARDELVKDSSTPVREQSKGGRSREHEKQIKDCSRTKNYSTVSLPNYSELDMARHSTPRMRGDEEEDGPPERAKSRRPVRSSTGSLPAESFLSPFSEKTSVRLEDYIPRRGSTENLSPYQILGKLDCPGNDGDAAGFVKYDPSKLEDWDLTDIGNCELNHRRRLSSEEPPWISDGKRCSKGEDVVDFAPSLGPGESEREHPREISGSPVILEKPSGFGKTPAFEEERDPGGTKGKDPGENLNGPHARFYDPPTLENCKLSDACDPSAGCTQPFFLDEEKQRAVLDTIGGSCRNGGIREETDGPGESRMILVRRLSNESEPYEDAYERKELSCPDPGVTGQLIRTISEESLPREMLEEVDRELDDFFDEKLAKDVHNKLKKDCHGPGVLVKTPPPSPEPRITAEILDNDHSVLLKVLKEEAAEESNLSSMTPSLTELEAALSDMLEKEEPLEEAKSGPKLEELKFPGVPERLLEPDIVPVEKTPAGFQEDSGTGRDGDKTLVEEDFEAPTEILASPSQDSKPVTKTRKVSFCDWDETRQTTVDSDRKFEERTEADDSRSERDTDKEQRSDAMQTLRTFEDTRTTAGDATGIADLPPEKPSRLQRSLEESPGYPGIVPTPPRRKNKGILARKDSEERQVDSGLNDRLI